jgi:hypothetical protein
MGVYYFHYLWVSIIFIKMLEFYKADQIFKQANSAKDLLRKKIEKLLESRV